MRIDCRTPRLIAFGLVAAAAACVLLACESKPKAERAAANTTGMAVEAPADPIDAMAFTQAQRLAEAMARSQAAEPDAGPTIEWIEPDPSDRPTPAPATAPKVSANLTSEATVSVDDPEWPTAEPKKPATQPAPAPMDRRALLSAMLAELRKGGDSAMNRALDATLLTLTQPGSDIDRSFIDPLDSDQREQLARFQSVVQLLKHQLTSGDGRINRTAAQEAIDEMFGPVPLEVRRVEICRKVEGYGVYEPFEGRTFLAGREHKMIVYVELDNFTAVKRGDGEFEVRLEQEIAIYTDWDGQKVWRNPTQEIVDRSQNRRRDFFVVQMITLPARLGVGKYVLKVDVTDKHGGSMDAVPIEINLVADHALVQSDKDRDRTQLIRQLLDEVDSKPLRGK